MRIYSVTKINNNVYSIHENKPDLIFGDIFFADEIEINHYRLRVFDNEVRFIRFLDDGRII